VQPGPKDTEAGRRREARCVAMEALNMTQESIRLDGEGDPKVGVDGPEAVRHKHGLRKPGSAFKASMDRRTPARSRSCCETCALG
jgi:hypothetical protein